MSSEWEMVKFRLIVMPCCRHQLCWVNPRLPNYCPECGANVMAEVKSSIVVVDDGAWLKVRRT
jgi:hypothetical protein